MGTMKPLLSTHEIEYRALFMLMVIKALFSYWNQLFKAFSSQCGYPTTPSCRYQHVSQ